MCPEFCANTSKGASHSSFLSQAYSVDLDIPRLTGGGRVDDISGRGSRVNQCGGRSVHGGIQRQMDVSVKSGGCGWWGGTDDGQHMESGAMFEGA